MPRLTRACASSIAQQDSSADVTAMPTIRATSVAWSRKSGLCDDALPSIGSDAGALADVGAVDSFLFPQDDRATRETRSELTSVVDCVLGNGMILRDRGTHTGTKAGQVLREYGFSCTGKARK